MKIKFLIVPLLGALLISNTEASCLKTMRNAVIAFKLNGELRTLLNDEFAKREDKSINTHVEMDKGVNTDEFCKSAAAKIEKNWDAVRKQKIKSSEMIEKELKVKGKVSEVIYAGLDGDSGNGKDITEKDICAKNDSFTKDMDGKESKICGKTGAMVNLAMNGDWDNIDFVEACKKWKTARIKDIQDSINCPESAETKREPPGEEIAPATSKSDSKPTPEPIKYKTIKNHTPDGPTGPLIDIGNTRKRRGGGGSAQ